jgi:TolB-like protein/DNA-binding winged helix-turn-helix (wHTH) protein/Tfp pilus assembly protein PilF
MTVSGLPSPDSPARRLRFDAFELDVRTGELRKNGVKLRLQGQPLQVLETLLKCAGDLVPREDLRAQIWPADTFVDFDHGLHNAIARLREVLGDSAETPRFIETLPRRGYRFIAPVASANGVAMQALPASVPSVPSPQPDAASDGLRRTSKVLALSLLVLALACLAFWRLRAAAPHASAAARMSSIAVLPLENLSGDPSQEYFVDGMTEQLITDLAQVGSLRVIARTSVMRYKGTKKPLPEIAQELNVDTVVEGSVVRSGQRIRVTAQLLQASTDRHLWAETYDRDLGDVLRLQGEVAQTIAEHVRAQLTPRQQAIFRSARPVNPEAYEDYLRGRYYLENQFTLAGPLKMAKTYFEESAQKDPQFASAYSGLALAYIFLAFYGNGQLSPDQAYRLAKEASQKALELNEGNGEAHYALALLSSQFEWDFKAAEREFDDSIALAPSYSCAHESRALFLALLGRRSEALEELAKIGQLDPGPGSMNVTSGTYYLLRDYSKLVEVSRQAVTSYPNEWTNHRELGIGYEATGQLKEAITEYQKAFQLSEGNFDATAFLAHAHAEAGRRDEAEKILAGLLQKSKTAHVSPYFIAAIYAGLHDKDRAFAFLEKAYQEKSTDMLWHLKGDVRLDNLRSDPRFQDLLRRVVPNA